MNGTDVHFRSRKFINAFGTLLITAFLAGHSELYLAKDSGDTALIIGAAGAIFGIILKLYNDVNLSAKLANGGDA